MYKSKMLLQYLQADNRKPRLELQPKLQAQWVISKTRKLHIFKCLASEIQLPTTTTPGSTISPAINIIIIPQLFIIIPSSIINRKRQTLRPLIRFPQSRDRIPTSPSRNEEAPALFLLFTTVGLLEIHLWFYALFPNFSLFTILGDGISSCDCLEDEVP
jgi:hypothetical protein